MSSYKGKFGYVRYYVRVVLDRPSQHALQCEREFEVEEPLDVNRPDLLVRTRPHVKGALRSSAVVLIVYQSSLSCFHLQSFVSLQVSMTLHFLLTQRFSPQSQQHNAINSV